MARKSLNRPNDPPSSQPTGQQQGKLAHQQIMQTRIHQGPLPHPEILQQYDQLSPGAANRIIAMAENESTHRHQMERLQIESDIAYRQVLTKIEENRISSIFSNDKTSQILGAGVSAIALLAAAVTAYAGLEHGVDSRWYWAIPVALVSLPVMGMVQAIRTRNWTRSQ